MTNDLIAFLRARLDEDEQAAREAAVWWGDSDEPGEAPHWRPVPCGRIWNDQDGGIADEVADQHAAHIARHDPAYVLADIDAKRRIIERAAGYADMEWIDDNPQRIGSGIAEEVLAEVLTLLALPYADHPEFKEEWRP